MNDTMPSKMPDLAVRSERIQVLREVAQDTANTSQAIADRIYGDEPQNDVAGKDGVGCAGGLGQMDACLDDLEYHLRRITAQVSRLNNL